MIENLITYSIRNKAIVLMATALLVVIGVLSIFKLKIDAVPDITNNQVQVITKANGLTALEVEKFLTAPLELGLLNLPNLIEHRSISRFGLSVITLVFDEDLDVLKSRQLVTEQLQKISSDWDTRIQKPELAPITTGLGEVYQYQIKPKKGYEQAYNLTQLRTIQDWQVKRLLAGIEGVIEINSIGGNIRQWEVAYRPDRLFAYSVSIEELQEALVNNNVNAGGGYVEKGPNAFFLSSNSLFKSLEEVKAIPVKWINGVPIKIEDLADVSESSSLRYGAMSANGEGEIVGGIILMLKGSNSSNVVEAIKARVNEINSTLPEGLVIEPFLERSSLIDTTISTVFNNLIEGALIVIFVLVLLLGNLRGGLIVGSVVPLALLFALICMNVFGVSANLMSLGAIDFGLVVDGSIIVVEATIHRLNHYQKSWKQGFTNSQLDDHVLKSAIGIRKTATFGEIIILIVYVPLLTLSGIEGKMFQPMAQTVMFALFGALVLSLTYVPAISAAFISKRYAQEFFLSKFLMQKAQNLYKPLLRVAVSKPKLTSVFAISLTLVTVFWYQNAEKRFLPELDEGSYAIEVRLPTGSSLSETLKVSKKMEKNLLELPEVAMVVSKIGTSDIPTDPMPIEANDLMVMLKPRNQWPENINRATLEEKIEEALAEFNGVGIEVTQPIQMRFNELITGVKSQIAIKIFGDDLDILEKLAFEIQTVLETNPAVASVIVEPIEKRPSGNLQLNRLELQKLEISASQATNAFQSSIVGLNVGTIYDGEQRFPLVIRSNKSTDNTKDQIQFIPLKNPDGKVFPIASVGEIVNVERPLQISREDGKRRVVVGLSLKTEDVEGQVAEIQTLINQRVNFPPNYYLKFGGEFENLLAAKERLAFAVPLALMLITILLFMTFKKFWQVGLILIAIPLSTVGGATALWLRELPFSIPAAIGFIALSGIAVLNGIVLLGQLNQLESEGVFNLKRRIFRACLSRLRPVLLTGLVASLGFLPMAFSESAGAEVQRPLATTVIGGVISAAMLTLLVIPALYYWYNTRNKASRISLIISGLVLFPIATQTLKAQTISLPEAKQALASNSLLSGSLKEKIEAIELLKSSLSDLGKTRFDLLYGQTQAAPFNDYTAGVSQSFFLPMHYSRLRNTIQAEKKLQEFELNELLRISEIILEQSFAQYQLNAFRQRYFLQVDSTLKKYQSNVKSNLKYGNTLASDTVVANVLLFENNRKLQVTTLENKSILRVVQLLTSKLEVQSLGLVILENFRLPPDEFVALEAIPELKRQDLVINQLDKQVAFEASKFYPELQLGYQNQSAEGVRNLQIVQLGIATNLLNNKATQQKVNSAKKLKSSEEKKREFMIAQLETESQNLIQKAKNLEGQISDASKLLQSNLNDGLKKILLQVERGNSSLTLAFPVLNQFIQFEERYWALWQEYLDVRFMYKQKFNR